MSHPAFFSNGLNLLGKPQNHLEASGSFTSCFEVSLNHLSWRNAPERIVVAFAHETVSIA
jgi:hypothetical protein